MDKIMVNICILFGLYILVFAMILADLWSGVRKAKITGEARTSYGYRQTIRKIAQYYNVMVALTVIDAMQMSVVWYLDQFYGHKIWLFPFVSLIGAIGIGLVEIKSIYEKAENKVKLDKTINLAGKIIANKDDLKEIIKEVTQYMTDENNPKSPQSH